MVTLCSYFSQTALEFPSCRPSFLCVTEEFLFWLCCCCCCTFYNLIKSCQLIKTCTHVHTYNMHVHSCFCSKICLIKAVFAVCVVYKGVLLKMYEWKKPCFVTFARNKALSFRLCVGKFKRWCFDASSLASNSNLIYLKTEQMFFSKPLFNKKRKKKLCEGFFLSF